MQIATLYTTVYLKDYQMYISAPIIHQCKFHKYNLLSLVIIICARVLYLLYLYLMYLAQWETLGSTVVDLRHNINKVLTNELRPLIQVNFCASPRRQYHRSLFVPLRDYDS